MDENFAALAVLYSWFILHGLMPIEDSADARDYGPHRVWELCAPAPKTMRYDYVLRSFEKYVNEYDGSFRFKVYRVDVFDTYDLECSGSFIYLSIFI